MTHEEINQLLVKAFDILCDVHDAFGKLPQKPQDATMAKAAPAPVFPPKQKRDFKLTKKVAEYVNQRSYVTTTEIAHAFGIPDLVANFKLASAARQGLIIRVSRGTYGRASK